jgi:hypothetical protein
MPAIERLPLDPKAATVQGHVLGSAIEIHPGEPHLGLRLNSTPVLRNRLDRGGFPCLTCILTLFMNEAAE